MLMDPLHDQQIVCDNMSISQDISMKNAEQYGEKEQQHAPVLQCCIHEGSWANIYRFDDPTNSFGGQTRALVVKALSEKSPHTSSSIECLRKERMMSAWLSSREESATS